MASKLPPSTLFAVTFLLVVSSHAGLGSWLLLQVLFDHGFGLIEVKAFRQFKLGSVLLQLPADKQLPIVLVKE